MSKVQEQTLGRRSPTMIGLPAIWLLSPSFRGTPVQVPRKSFVVSELAIVADNGGSVEQWVARRKPKGQS